jgi:hypothetical protein
MQKQQEQHGNAEAAGATLQFSSSRRYNIMQIQQVLHCNSEVAGATL